MNNSTTNDDIQDISSIGRDIALLRMQLNMTQQQFATAIFLSRITINKIERTSEITADSAYRIYYATDKVINNHYIPENIRRHAEILQKRIEHEFILAESEKYNPIIHSNQ